MSSCREHRRAPGLGSLTGTAPPRASPRHRLGRSECGGCRGPRNPGFCSRPAEQPSSSAHRTRSLSRDRTRKRAAAPSHGPRVHRAAPSRRCHGRESGRAANSLRPGLGQGLGRGWRRCHSGRGARGCLGAAAAGTHKPRGESWSWWARGARGPWWSGWSGGSCQAILPRSASGAGVTLVSLHRWGDRMFPLPAEP